MLFNVYGLYVPIECSNNNIEMTEDDHVQDNTKYMNLKEDNFEATQCVIMANIVIASEADRTCGRSSSIKVALQEL